MEHFLEFEYWYPPFGLYSNSTSADGLQRTQTFLGIKQVPTSKTPATTDTFDIDIKRTTSVTTTNTRTTQEFCFDKNEGGYYQILRLSRTLAILLGVDSWEEQNSFPKCEWSTTNPQPNNIKKGINDKFYAKVSPTDANYRVLIIPPKRYSFDELAYHITVWASEQWPHIFTGSDDLVTRDPDPQWTQAWLNIPPNSNFTINFNDTSAPTIADKFSM